MLKYIEFTKGDDLEEISWDNFFTEFEAEELDFSYKDKNFKIEIGVFAYVSVLRV